MPTPQVLVPPVPYYVPVQPPPGEYPPLDAIPQFKMIPQPMPPGGVNILPPNAMKYRPGPMPTKLSEMSSMDNSEQDESFEKVVESIFNLRFPDKREEALMELGRKRESFKSLAPLMWYSFGTIAIL